MPLILVRHSRPVVQEGVCYGKTDLPTTPENAIKDAQRLHDSLPYLEYIVTSPLARAAYLANELGALRNVSVTQDARLQEMDFGAWEGRLWNNIPRAELDLWADDLLNARPHGGESVQMMAERVSAALNAYQDAIIVTHLGPIRAALKNSGHDDAWNAKVDFATTVSF